MSTFLENKLKFSHNITNLMNFDNLSLFTAISLILGVATIILFKRDKDTWHKSAPSLITSLGILCTFVGVSCGLLRFNPDNINSLNSLFAGLKLAFIPSALAVLIAISFKWLHTKNHTQNAGAQFLAKLEQNTAAVEHLANAIQVVDWQVAYKQNLELNIEHNAQLLAVLETSLANLLQTLNNRGSEIVTASCDLKQSIQDTNKMLQSINQELNSTMQQVTKFEQQQQTAANDLQSLHNEYANFRQMMQQLQSVSSELTTDLKVAVNNHVRGLEQAISSQLRQTVTQIGS